jgi:hypothetical protein
MWSDAARKHYHQILLTWVVCSNKALPGDDETSQSRGRNNDADAPGRRPEYTSPYAFWGIASEFNFSSSLRPFSFPLLYATHGVNTVSNREKHTCFFGHQDQQGYNTEKRRALPD